MLIKTRNNSNLIKSSQNKSLKIYKMKNRKNNLSSNNQNQDPEKNKKMRKRRRKKENTILTPNKIKIEKSKKQQKLNQKCQEKIN